MKGIITKTGLNAILFILLSLMFLSCAARQSSLSESGENIVSTTSDDEVAARKLADLLEYNGVSIRKRGDDWIGVEINDTNFVLQPKMSNEGIDRIVAQVYLGIEDEYRNSQEVKEMVWKLNQNFNVAQFYLDSDGDLVMLMPITFVDRINLKEIKYSLEFMSKSILKVVLHAPEALNYLQ